MKIMKHDGREYCLVKLSEPLSEMVTIAASVWSVDACDFVEMPIIPMGFYDAVRERYRINEDMPLKIKSH